MRRGSRVVEAGAPEGAAPLGAGSVAEAVAFTIGVCFLLISLEGLARGGVFALDVAEAMGSFDATAPRSSIDIATDGVASAVSSLLGADVAGSASVEAAA